ncbi:hypothetical protein BU23DRAFT_557674 [Bimuria novae-zelandiae CBS 107.79]|uniref:SAM domain-containing protein n=1 Tax=Bimuria novae-zelandiae CBS 107.79 TaxID=1447943 RepID=A0A6A5UZW5_9PLEO|nr:hypothetical protein BU23DRAFT_557674 [Bimuria novae-zelandiae CBS 107.79]
MTDDPFATKATIGAFEFETALAQVGLAQYEGPLREHGFLDWESVTGITESDMAKMDFRLGDRRKLQRMIRKYTTLNTPKVRI